MATINLANPTTIIVTPQVTKTISTITIQRLVDNPTQQVVRAFVAELNQPIVLWDSTTTPTYAGIGQWSDTDVSNRIQQLYA